MYSKTIFFFAALCMSFSLAAQVIYTDPVFPNVDDNVTVYFNAAEGNQALKNSTTPIYAHTGVITDASTTPSDWKHVKSAWATTDPNVLLTSQGNNIYSISFNIRTYYNIAANENVLKLAFVFRDATGSTVGRNVDGSDILYDVVPANVGLQVQFLTPTSNSLITQLGQNISVKAAATQNANLKLTDNSALLTEVLSGKTLNYNLNVTSAGTHEVKVTATNVTETKESVFFYVVPKPLQVSEPPAGMNLGANYLLGDTSILLKFYAPNKQNIFVIGNFNNWTLNTNYQMNRSADGATWWLVIGGLSPLQRVNYQYVVDGSLKVADPLSELILSADDAGISASTFPNLPAYPTGKTTGTVSTIQIGKPAFAWQANNYVAPPKTNLVIYETLLRDFVANHDYKTMSDTLNYFQKLGINCIELMPVNEFDGNKSWGYNPSYHMALDKYYGSPESFKTFIDEAHKRGISVVLDVVFNHTTGSSPLAQLYWDSANNRPTLDNPWLNPVAKHPYNVFNDFNHESNATKEYMYRCLKYWLSEYRIDGFRFDLSKGFTQKNSGNDVGLWGNYDASRIAILKQLNDTLVAANPKVYTILEHFGGNQEEKELSNLGMMLWGNTNYGAGQASMGFGDGNLQGTATVYRGWTVQHLVGYMESHDEERNMFRNLKSGRNAADYDVKELATALRRQELTSCFFYPVQGPKMLWQFGELGYDYSINTCSDGVIISNNCRLAEKPIRWDYLQNADRKRLLNVTSSLINLKKSEPAFFDGDFYYQIGSVYQKKIQITHSSMNVNILGNFDLSTQPINPEFQNMGKWYDYFSGDSINVTNVTENIILRQGEYRLYTTKKLAPPVGGYIKYVLTENNEIVKNDFEISVNPNPTSTEAELTIKPTSNVKEVVIELIDVLGRVVETNKIDFQQANSSTVKIGNSLKAGTYIIKITNNNLKSFQKFIKI